MVEKDTKPDEKMIRHVLTYRDEGLGVLKSINASLLKILILTLLLGGFTSAAPVKIVTLHQPPIQFIESGVVKGIAIDLIKEVFKRMNTPIDIQIFPFARTLNLMKSEQADAVLTIVKNPEREQFLAYPKEVLLNQEAVMVVRKNDPVVFDGEFKNLSQKTFGVLHSATYGSAFEQALSEGKVTKFETVENYQQSALMLMAGRIDVMIGPRLTLLYALKQTGHSKDYRVLSPAIQQVPTYFAFAKRYQSSELLEAFEQTLQAIKRDRTYDQIINRYIE